MILSKVTNHLREHGRASLSDMAANFSIAPDALRDMLAMLERKGRIHRLPAGTSCSGCSKCQPENIEIYEWHE